MARRAGPCETNPKCPDKRQRAKAALDAVIESIHDEHRILEGEELVRAVEEVFGVVRGLRPVPEPK